MLSERRVHTTLPAQDIDRARRFYEETLGFTPRWVTPAGAMYDAGEGTLFFVFPSAGRPSGEHTQISFTVTDIDGEVTDLKRRGVAFESYDFPGFDNETSIAQAGPNRTAWFRDSEGNLVGLIEFADPG